VAKYTIDIEVNSKSINDLKAELKTLETEFKALKIDDPGFVALGNQIRGVKSEIKNVNNCILYNFSIFIWLSYKLYTMLICNFQSDNV
jgi:hypothetical protein